MFKKIKAKIFDIIQPAGEGNVASRIFDLFIMTLIFLSIVSVFAATFSPPRAVRRALWYFEVFSVAIFTIEYLLRLWTADMLYPDLSPVRARIKYCKSGMAIIDLIAIVPFYLPFLIPVNLLGLRAIRLVRLLRIFKFNRYSDALMSIGDIFRQKSRELGASLFFVMILMVIASLLIYHAEHDAQPEQFQNAFSGLWWAVATLTTVGYGDIYPVTVAGRILGAVIAILGIGMVAIPTGILSSGFMEHLATRNKADEKSQKNENPDDEINYCPHCGKKLK